MNFVSMLEDHNHLYYFELAYNEEYRKTNYCKHLLI